MKKRTRLYNFLIDSIIFFIIVFVFSKLLKEYVERQNLKYLMILLYYLFYFRVNNWSDNRKNGY